jgi:hypothetical protein
MQKVRKSYLEYLSPRDEGEGKMVECYSVFVLLALPANGRTWNKRVVIHEVTLSLGPTLILYSLLHPQS